MTRILEFVAAFIAIATLAACSKPPSESKTESAPAPAPAAASEVASQPLKQAYFGDLHLHTALSIDAFITGTRTMPDDAYKYAKGEPIDHISGHKIQLKTPLDFLAVTDHSEVIGVALAMNDPNSPLSKLPIAVQITSTDFATSQKAFQTIVAATAAGKVRLGEAPPTGVASTIQERAFSSPIWVAQ